MRYAAALRLASRLAAMLAALALAQSAYAQGQTGQPAVQPAPQPQPQQPQPQQPQPQQPQPQPPPPQSTLQAAELRLQAWLKVESDLASLALRAPATRAALSARTSGGSKDVTAALTALDKATQDIATQQAAAASAARGCVAAVGMGAAATLDSCDDPAAATRSVTELGSKVDAADTTAAATPAAGAVDTLLSARCKTAICFKVAGKQNWLGIDPLVELPISKTFSLGSGTVADYVNNTGVRVDLAAGLRIWVFRDIVSLSVYLSQVLATDVIRVKGVDAQLPASNLRRPYPGVALGLFFDTLWLSIDRDVLYNGSGANADPHFGPNAAIASTWSITLGIQPITATRTGIAVITDHK